MILQRRKIYGFSAGLDIGDKTEETYRQVLHYRNGFFAYKQKTILHRKSIPVK
jgi:hypothetical protein